MRPLALFVAAAIALGCSGAGGGSNPGAGGGGGSAAGGSGGSGGSGGGAPFTAFAPCASEASYVAGTTIAFGGAVGFDYAPKCLQVPAGATVTFSGDFATHPLIPSAMRGMTSGNPIAATSTGTSAAFTFATPGFYAYLCMFHGSDDGTSMSGVIWVQ